MNRAAAQAQDLARVVRGVLGPASRWRPIAVVIVLIALAVGLPLAAIIIAIGGTRDPAEGVTTASTSDLIPADALAAYQSAAATYDIDWTILAAIGWEECRQGTYEAPGCIPDTVNPVGARGYMQFIGPTWRRGLQPTQLEPRTSAPAPDGQGYATDGDQDGDADPWSWPDATHSAARYLVDVGIHNDVRTALYSYNHSQAYVDQVLATADSYRQPDTGSLDLVTVEGITVNTTIGSQVEALVQAAHAASLELTGSGYRSHERQIELREAHCGTSQYAIYEMPSSSCSPPTARPGASMHEQGLAIDFSCDGQLITSRTSACYEWLATNAATYGLYELSSGAEPWHFSTSGR